MRSQSKSQASLFHLDEQPSIAKKMWRACILEIARQDQRSIFSQSLSRRVRLFRTDRTHVWHELALNQYLHKLSTKGQLQYVQRDDLYSGQQSYLYVIIRVNSLHFKIVT